MHAISCTGHYLCSICRLRLSVYVLVIVRLKNTVLSLVRQCYKAIKLPNHSFPLEAQSCQIIPCINRFNSFHL